MSQARQNRTTFKLEVAVDIEISATPARVWALLTNASQIPNWNSVVSTLEGHVAEGEKIALTVPYSDRTFTLKVSDVQPEKGMVWSDGFAPMFRGVRTFTLTPTDTGVRFAMVEVLSGLMFPMIASSLPDFGPAFEAWARDLKAAAEE